MKGDDISRNLSVAARLLSKPGAWTRGKYAKPYRAATYSTTPTDPSASCFCIAGAVARAFGVSPGAVPMRAWDRITAALGLAEDGGDGPIVAWNDSPAASQKRAVAALRKAAKL